jgi:hypothetical protein
MNGEVSVKFSRQEAQFLAALVSKLLDPDNMLEHRITLGEGIVYKLETAIMAGSDELSCADLSVIR